MIPLTDSLLAELWWMYCLGPKSFGANLVTVAHKEEPLSTFKVFKVVLAVTGSEELFSVDLVSHEFIKKTIITILRMFQGMSDFQTFFQVSIKMSLELKKMWS